MHGEKARNTRRDLQRVVCVWECGWAIACVDCVVDADDSLSQIQWPTRPKYSPPDGNAQSPLSALCARKQIDSDGPGSSYRMQIAKYRPSESD